MRNGKLTTIIFIRDLNAKKQEVSGYIDYAHRLKTENWEPIFDRTQRLLPKATDLSFSTGRRRKQRAMQRRIFRLSVITRLA